MVVTMNLLTINILLCLNYWQVIVVSMNLNPPIPNESFFPFILNMGPLQ
jgi:hypothetical protein